MGSIFHYFTKVVGVTFPNPDGTSRQRILAGCQVGEQVSLVPEPDNPFDRNAIAVTKLSGQQIGHIGRGEAADLVARIKSGARYYAFISALTGHPLRGESRGVILLVLQPSPDTAWEDVQNFVRETVQDSAEKSGCLTKITLVLLAIFVIAHL